MSINELSNRLEQSIGDYAVDVQTLITSNTDLLNNEELRPLLIILDEMNRCHYKAMAEMKKETIMYLKGKE